MRGYGEHIQYSVFLCQLTDKDMVVLKEKLSDITNQNEDQVMLIRLGSVDAANQVGYPKNWQVIGRKVHLRDTKVMVF
jgi:CRISPR-associated protein Cas2